MVGGWGNVCLEEGNLNSGLLSDNTIFEGK